MPVTARAPLEALVQDTLLAGGVLKVATIGEPRTLEIGR
jgi:hypothetical protein